MQRACPGDLYLAARSSQPALLSVVTKLKRHKASRVDGGNSVISCGSASTERDARIGWLRSTECRVDDLLELISSSVDLRRYPSAAGKDRGIVIYDGRTMELNDREQPFQLQSEMMDILMTGPGVLVVKHAFTHDVVDKVSAEFDKILASGLGEGDHFSRAGANGRIWNALEKLAVCNPAAFVEYYSNATLATVSRAWLGPGYQVTSQVNVVYPGGEAQVAHRDYHLGFCTNAVVEQYPAHVHVMSQALTLQGAVAHCDMPIESGPTTYLPYSQKYMHGYLAWCHDDFKELYMKHRVQLPLSKGDAVFFNPAVLHAAGENSSKDIKRMANLLQVNSAFGRSMETVDRVRMVKLIYPELLRRATEKLSGRTLSTYEVQCAIAACAEGYSFPTNLDRDPPIGGLAPETQVQLMTRALAEKWPVVTFNTEIDKQRKRMLSH